MPIVVGIVLWLSGKGVKKALFSFAIVFLMGSLLTIPWALRNYRIWGIYIPYTTDYSDLYGCMNVQVKDVNISTQFPKEGQSGYVKDFYTAMQANDIPKIKKICEKEVRGYIFHHPLHFIKNGFKKEWYFLWPNCKKGIWPIDLMDESMKKTPGFNWNDPSKYVQRMLALQVYAFLLICSVIGIILPKRMSISLITVSLCFLFYLAEQFIIYPEVKYRYPLEIFMMIFAAHAVNKIAFDKTLWK